jgi:ABC-type multidrug transport system ATPase subunit
VYYAVDKNLMNRSTVDSAMAFMGSQYSLRPREVTASSVSDWVHQDLNNGLEYSGCASPVLEWNTYSGGPDQLLQIFFACSEDVLHDDVVGGFIFGTTDTVDIDSIDVFVKSVFFESSLNGRSSLLSPNGRDYSVELTQVLFSSLAHLDVDIEVRPPPHVAELTGQAAGGSGVKPAVQREFMLNVESVSLVAVILIGTFTYYGSAANALAYERRLKLRNHLKMIGVSVGPYLNSFVLTESIVALIGCLILIPVGRSLNFMFFVHTEASLLILILSLLALNLVINGLFLATLIHKPLTSNCILVLSFMGGIPSGALSAIPGICGALWNDGAIPFSALGFMQHFGAIASAIYEFIMEKASKPGSTAMLTWHMVFGDGLRDACSFDTDGGGYYTLRRHLGIMAILFVVGWLLILYLDHIWPGEFGAPHAFGFPLDPRYWNLVPTRARAAVDLESFDRNNYNTVLASLDPDVNAETQRTFRDVQSDTPKYSLQICKLSKTFQKRGGCCGCGKSSSVHDARALDSLTLSASAGQILVLLAHNGGGKSTLINILNGLIAPTHGDAFVFGRSIVSDPDSVRACMGSVPQENLLWDKLTVQEHVLMFTRLRRGYTGQAAIDEAAEKVEDVGLTADRHSYAGTLSGGMKRRLCLAMSIATNPVILCTDEVSAGCDPESKLRIFDAIRKLRDRGSLVVMVTHDLAEAEQLSDKVALLALGQLRAVGTVFHLKRRFGQGYVVELTVKEGARSLIKRIQSLFPSLSVSEQDLSGFFQLNVPMDQLAQLQSVLRQLEEDADGELKDWSVSESTLESIFFKVTHGGGDGEEGGGSKGDGAGADGADDDDVSSDEETLRAAGSGAPLLVNLLWEGDESSIVASISVPRTATLGDVRRQLLRRELLTGDQKHFAFVEMPAILAEDETAVSAYPSVLHLRPVAPDAASDTEALRRQLAAEREELAIIKGQLEAALARLAKYERV